MIDKALLKQARKNLKSRAAALKGIQFSEPITANFSFAQIRTGFGTGHFSRWIRPLIGEEDGTAAIYRLFVENQEVANRLRNAFENSNGRNGHVFARNNRIADSTTLYVGSSQKIGQRLQQHLFTCAAKTYALKMHLWCPVGIDHIRVEVSTAQGDVDPSQVQDVEDALWEKLRPVFGKFGAK